MSSERHMRTRVVKALRPLHAVAVENPVCPGTPDVNYADGMLELKSLPEWPTDPRSTLLVPHFTPQQRLWLRKRHLAGGRVHLLLKVEDDWLLIPGYEAAVHVGRARREVLLSISERRWEGGLRERELLSCLKKI